MLVVSGYSAITVSARPGQLESAVLAYMDAGDPGFPAPKRWKERDWRIVEVEQMKKARKSELSSGSSKLDFRPVPEIESFTNLSFLKADSGRGARLSAVPKME